MGKKKKEELPSEEYQQKAQKHMKAFKQEWLTFFRTGLFMYGALLAIIIASIAWFVSNTKVTASGTKIQAAGSEFDLAAAIESENESSTGAYDELLDVPSGTKESIGGRNFLTTGGGKTSIAWAITTASNIRNQTDRGIEPGSRGKLMFYIISHKNGPLSVTLDLQMTGYKSTTDAPISSTNIKEIDLVAQQLLEGHLLVFAGYDSDSNSYKGWISEDATSWVMDLGENNTEGNRVTLSRNEDGRLVWTAENAVKDTAYLITLYWIWPEMLESYLMNAQTYTGRRPLLFPVDSTTDGSGDNLNALPSTLFATMCNMENKPDVTSNRYFYWEDAADFKANVTAATLLQMRTNFNPIIYSTISTYYNLADQYIGENVQYVKLKVNAQ